MNRTISVVLILFPCTLALSQSFEGVMTFRTSGRSVQEFTYSSKGDKVRMDMEPAPGMSMEMILDTRTNTMVVIRNDAQVYFEMDLSQIPPPPPAAMQDVSVKKTGLKETILGYECEQMIIEQEERSAELWVTKGLGRFVQMNLNPRAQSPMLKKLEDELIDQGYFPLRLVTKNRSGQEQTRMEVLKIEKKPLPDELFTVPAGYQQTQMPPPPKH